MDDAFDINTYTLRPPFSKHARGLSEPIQSALPIEVIESRLARPDADPPSLATVSDSDGVTDDIPHILQMFMDDMRAWQHIVRGFRATLRQFTETVEPLLDERQYFWHLPGGGHVAQRYHNSLKDEYFQLLSRARDLKIDLGELCADWFTLCEDPSFTVPVSEVLERGYVLEHLLQRSIESRLVTMAEQMDEVRDHLRLCHLGVLIFYRFNYNDQIQLLQWDEWATYSVLDKMLDTKRPTIDAEDGRWHPGVEEPMGLHDEECRYSTSIMDWNEAFEDFSDDESGELYPGRGEGWWRSRPEALRDPKRFSETRWSSLNYKSWNHRRRDSNERKYPIGRELRVQNNADSEILRP